MIKEIGESVGAAMIGFFMGWTFGIVGIFGGTGIVILYLCLSYGGS